MLVCMIQAAIILHQCVIYYSNKIKKTHQFNISLINLVRVIDDVLMLMRT